jgi:biopolymer transport protein ExbD
LNIRGLTLALTIVVGSLDPASAQRTPVSFVTIVVESDGVYLINGRRYADEKLVLARLKEIFQRKPQPGVKIVTPKGIEFKAMGHLILLLQEAGVAKVGFLTEPTSQ